MTWGNPPKLKSDPPKQGKAVTPEQLAASGTEDGEQRRIPELMTENIILISRAEALQQNLATYFTGIPCGYGHIAEIYVCNGTCKACQRERSREYGRRNIKKIVDRFKVRVYGIEPRKFEEMLIEQNNKCLVCEETFNTSNLAHKGPHLDHNHTTGKIRGILCRNCNTGLGLFKDNLARLKKAITYLEKYDGMEQSSQTNNSTCKERKENIARGFSSIWN